MKHGLTETMIQRAVFLHLRTRPAPGVFAFHPANGGYRRPTEAKILKSLGVVAGVPDVIIIHEGRIYALELKTKIGRETPQQLRTMTAMSLAGAIVGIAYGLDEAIAWLEGWGLLKRSRSDAFGRSEQLFEGATPISIHVGDDRQVGTSTKDEGVGAGAQARARADR